MKGKKVLGPESNENGEKISKKMRNSILISVKNCDFGRNFNHIKIKISRHLEILSIQSFM